MLPLAAADPAVLRTAAFGHLDAALDLGWGDRSQLETDPDLTALHDDPRWGPLVGRLGGR